MKIRAGFVSNSSSSSFVVAIPKGTELTVDSVGKVLFPNTTDITRIGFSCCGDSGVSGTYAAEIVSTDLKNKNPNDDNLIKEALNGWIDVGSMNSSLYDQVGSPPKYPERAWEIKDHQEMNRIFNEYETAFDVWIEKVIITFKSMNDQCDIYALEYSDNEGSVNTVMEHGGVFDRMIDAGTAIRISHH